MKTLVAVTSQNKKDITGHAGHCRVFYMYSIENDEIIKKDLLELKKEEVLHEILHADKPVRSELFDADIMLTGGIGGGAVQKLATHNVACYIVEEKDPDVAIEKLIKGVLEAYAPVSHKGGCNCGHDHGHGHHHNHHHH